MKMGMKEAVITVFKNYALFKGRAQRREFWLFYAFDVGVVASLLILGSILSAIVSDATPLASIMQLIWLYGLATLVPWLAVSCRRMHDIGKSGAYLLFYLIPVVGYIIVLVWLIQDGQMGPNQYGPNPKGVTAAAVKTCPYCGTTVNVSDRFCPVCGKSVDDYVEKKAAPAAAVHPGKSCPSCGAKLKDDDKFCPHCGSSVSGGGSAGGTTGGYSGGYTGGYSGGTAGGCTGGSTSGYSGGSTTGSTGSTGGASPWGDFTPPTL